MYYFEFFWKKKTGVSSRFRISMSSLYFHNGPDILFFFFTSKLTSINSEEAWYPPKYVPGYNHQYLRPAKVLNIQTIIKL